MQTADAAAASTDGRALSTDDYKRATSTYIDAYGPPLPSRQPAYPCLQ
ncbi:hypothetical protein [Streptomyces sp. NRRL B-3229]|nr:hypothetical protein [Streptomyces sp. NRRL B-3229]